MIASSPLNYIKEIKMMSIEWMMAQIVRSAEARANRLETTPEDEWADEVEEAAIDGMLYLLDKWITTDEADHAIYGWIGQSAGPEVLGYIELAKRNHVERVARTTKLNG